jgi:hypothetical protein
MASKDTRRHRRFPYAGVVRVSWDDGAHGARFARGKCFDVSESGLRVELPVSIPARTIVTLGADGIQVSGAASVKHVERFGAKYLVGLQLNSGVSSKALDSVREPFSV